MFSSSVFNILSTLVVHRRRATEVGEARLLGTAVVKPPRYGWNRCGEDKDGATKGGAAAREDEGGMSKSRQPRL